MKKSERNIENTNIVMEKMDNMALMLQKIHEDYFEKYDANNSDDRIAIAYEYQRYAVFFRILMICFDDVMAVLNKTKTNEF